MSWWHNILTGAARPVLTYMSQNRLPQTAGKLRVAGLSAPVLVRRDAWGLPHIEADNAHDLFFTQGFVQAQDRLWQLDLNRRVAQGEMAAVVGAEGVGLDRVTRTLGFARLGAQLEKHLTETQRAIITAYTAGVNAWLGQISRLPVEFSLLRYEPRPWTNHDTLAIIRLNTWILARGWSSETTRAQLVQAVGAELTAELGLIDPTADILHHLTDLTFAPLAHSDSAEKPLPLPLGAAGSNSWAIAPQHTTHGRAIHAADPHLPLSVPSVWHYAHLRSKDGWHVTGIGLVGAPGIMMGHNEYIAWGITLSYADGEDLFVERFNEAGTAYETAEGWREATILEEKIEVKGEEPIKLKITQTAHGPLVNGLLTAVAQPTALCSVALQDNPAGLPLIDLGRAANWEQFLAIAQAVPAPALHYTYADNAGNIGQCLTGQLPIRAGGRGLLPAPGWTGEADWVGFVPVAQLPTQYNPPTGFVVTCNERPQHLSSDVFLGDTWMSPQRRVRLTHLFDEADQPHSTQQSGAWQMDQFNEAGHQLAQLTVATLRQPENARLLDEATQQGVALLAEWDGFMTAKSGGAAIIAVLTRQLAERILAPLVGEDLTLDLLGKGPHPVLYPVNELLNKWPEILLALWENPKTGWLAGQHGRVALLNQALSHTITQLRKTLGPRPSLWQWGDLHPLHIPHPLGNNWLINDIFSLHRTEHGGEGNSVAQSSSVPLPAHHIRTPADNFGVSYRQLHDVGAWESGQMVFTPGQSGHLGSPHYADLLPVWAEGRYVPTAWSVEQVAQASRQALTLLPGE